MIQIVKRAKQSLFARIRAFYVFRRWIDLRNFLKNPEIKDGTNTLRGKRILVISPHPDDESLGCGGTLKIASGEKCHIDVAILSPGERGSDDCDRMSAAEREALVETRRKEATLAAGELGAKNVFFLDSPDGAVHADTDLSKSLREILQQGKYDVLFCPWPYDSHSDHSAAFHHTATALESLRAPLEVWLYEVWNPLIPNRVVNIDTAIESKRAALNHYQSQLKSINYTEKFIALASYRSLLCPKARYAEAFFVGERESIAALKRA